MDTDYEIDIAIKEAEEEYKNGAELIDAREALMLLRGKYFE